MGFSLSPLCGKKSCSSPVNGNRGANAKNSCESGNNTRTSFYLYTYMVRALRVTAALRAKSKATSPTDGKLVGVIKNSFLTVVESHRHIALWRAYVGEMGEIPVYPFSRNEPAGLVNASKLLEKARNPLPGSRDAILKQMAGWSASL